VLVVETLNLDVLEMKMSLMKWESRPYLLTQASLGFAVGMKLAIGYKVNVMKGQVRDKPVALELASVQDKADAEE
jgi:hypothetical protein